MLLRPETPMILCFDNIWTIWRNFLTVTLLLIPKQLLVRLFSSSHCETPAPLWHKICCMLYSWIKNLIGNLCDDWWILYFGFVKQFLLCVLQANYMYFGMAHGKGILGTWLSLQNYNISFYTLCCVILYMYTEPVFEIKEWRNVKYNLNYPCRGQTEFKCKHLREVWERSEGGLREVWERSERGLREVWVRSEGGLGLRGLREVILRSCYDLILWLLYDVTELLQIDVVLR